jgi:hypothetical protein
VLNTRWVRRARGLGAVALLIVPLIACDEDIEIDYSPSGTAALVNSIKVTLGTQTMTVFKDGRITLGPLALVRPSATITATLLDANDQPIPTAQASDVQVNMGRENNSSGLGITFTRTSPFGGTLAATTAGTSSFTISVFDKINRRTAFGPFTVALLVR